MVRDIFRSFLSLLIDMREKLIRLGSNLVCRFAAIDGHRLIETQSLTAFVFVPVDIDKKLGSCLSDDKHHPCAELHTKVQNKN